MMISAIKSYKRGKEKSKDHCDVAIEWSKKPSPRRDLTLVKRHCVTSEAKS